MDAGDFVTSYEQRGVEFALGIVVAATTTIGGSTGNTTGLLTNLVYV